MVFLVTRGYLDVMGFAVPLTRQPCQTFFVNGFISVATNDEYMVVPCLNKNVYRPIVDFGFVRIQ
jgi:hypothetical protein